MKKNSIKRILLMFIVAVLMPAMSAMAANEPVSEDFESDPVINAANGWTLTRPDTAQDTLSIVDHWSNEGEHVLQFKPNKSNEGLVMAERNFPGFTGKVVVDMEIMFSSIGDANILYAKQGNDNVFNISASGGQIIMYVGKGAYDNSYSLTSLVPTTDFKVNVPYRFTVMLCNDKINAFVNGKHIVVNQPTRIKLTSGLSKLQIFMTNKSEAVMMLDNLSVYNAAGEIAMLKDAKILKTPYVNKTVSAGYGYEEGYENVNTVVNWMSSNSQDGAYGYIPSPSGSKNYKVRHEDIGKWLKAEIIPVTADGIFGAPVYTDAVQDKSVRTETGLSGASDWSGSTVSDGVIKYTSMMTKTTDTPISGDTIIEFEILMSVKQAANLYVYQDSGYAFTMSFTDTNLQAGTGNAKNSGWKPSVILSSYEVNKWYKVKAVLYPRATSSADASYVDLYVDDKLVLANAFLRSDLTTKGINKVVFNSAGKEVNVRNFSVYKAAQPTEKLVISGFKVVDENGEAVEGISKDITATLKADVSLLDGERELLLVLAYYSEDGIEDLELVDAKLTDGDILTLATEPLAVKYTEGKTSVKGFIWDKENLIPLDVNIEF